MYLCQLFNISVGIPSYKSINLLYTDDSINFKGILAKEFQMLIRPKKNFPEYCKLINIYNVGSKLINGSFDGALGAFEKKEIDIYLKAEIPFISNENIYPSFPISTEEFFIYQTINKKKVDESEFELQLINSFNFEFLSYYFLVTFLFITIIWHFYFNISFFIKKKNQPKIIFIALKVIEKTRIDKLKCYSFIFFGLIWFDFLAKQIMTNNIKTSKVIVDTSQFITSEEKLFESPLKAAWLEGESDLDIVKNAPKNTFLYKLYLLKNENPIKFVAKNLNFKTISRLNENFFFMKSYFLKITVSLINTMRNDDGFYDQKSFYSVFTFFYIRKTMDPKKIKLIYKTTKYLGQSGISTYSIERATNIKVFEKKSCKVYRNLNTYIDDNTKFDSLGYIDFRYFFLVFFSSSFLFFLLFTFHLVINILDCEIF